MNRSGLVKLIKGKFKPPCISVYLGFNNVNFLAAAEALAAYNSLVHREIQKSRNLKKEDFKIQVDKLKKVIRSLRLPGGHIRGVSVFTAPDLKEAQVFFLRHPRETLRVSSSFYLSPLIREYYETLDFCFCFLDERKARLVILTPFEVLKEVEIDDRTPEKVKSGGWYGLEEKKITRHIEEHIRVHFQVVAGKIRELFQQFGFGILVLFFSSKHMQIFKKMLPENAGYRIKEVSAIKFNASLEAIRKLAEEIEQVELEKRRIRVLKELEDRLSRGQAVTGMEAFLRAWNEGLVEKVLIREDFETRAFVCPNCRQYQLKPDSCLLCGEKVKGIDFFTDELVKECFVKNIEVFWSKDFPFDLGAILQTYLF